MDQPTDGSEENQDNESHGPEPQQFPQSSSAQQYPQAQQVPQYPQTPPQYLLQTPQYQVPQQYQPPTYPYQVPPAQQYPVYPQVQQPPQAQYPQYPQVQQVPPAQYPQYPQPQYPQAPYQPAAYQVGIYPQQYPYSTQYQGYLPPQNQVFFPQVPVKIEMERGKFLKLTGLLTVPLSFVVMTVLGFVLGIFLAMTSVGGSGNLDSAMSSSIFLIITLYATIASYPVLLAFPFIRRAMRELDFFGLTRLKERMHTQTTGGAVAKAMGVGTLTTVLFIGFEVLASYVISLIPSLSWMSGTSKDTSTTSGEISSALEGSNLVGALLTIVATEILIPICEEIVFRGFTAMSLRESSIFSKLRQGPRTFLICIISGLYFGAVHFQSSAPLAVSIYTMILMTIFGTALTYIAAFKYRSLAPTLWAHMLNNAIAMF